MALVGPGLGKQRACHFPEQKRHAVDDLLMVRGLSDGLYVNLVKKAEA